jgi:RNA polymerase sporulation-specific sigma factor
MYNRVQICGISTTQLPKVDQKKSTEMLLRIKGGEEHLKEQFITSNLRLVLSVVQKFYNRNENLDDLFQIGCIGLIKALENFDFKFNVRFSTYAVPTDIS